jgi:hypothetical protein
MRKERDMLHILFSHAAKATFTQAFQETIIPFSGEVLVFEPYLQLGSLGDETKRMKELSVIFGIKAGEEERGALLKQFQQQVVKIQEAVNRGHEITFWVGEEAADEIAMMYLIDELDSVNQATCLYLNRVRGTLLVRELPPERLEAHFLPIELSSDAIRQLLLKWNELKKEESDLRIRRTDFIYDHLDYSYYDSKILTLMDGNGGTLVAKLVGEIYGREPHLPFPFFLWRIMVLVEMNIIEWVEKMENAMMSKVMIRK